MNSVDAGTPENASGAEQSVADYAAAVASGAPTPGGGSVVATVAALAAGLVEMVCDLTLKRQVPAETVAALTSTKTEAGRLRVRFLQLAGEDERAYTAYRDAAGLPKASPAERAARQEALEAALRRSADVPLEVAIGCVSLLGLLETVGERGTRHASADTRTGVFLADAALAGALEMVKANTDLMKDRDQAVDLERRIEELGAAGKSAKMRALASLVLDHS
jgi:formiminotetrahydrofolate cyclodeaminase